MTEVWTVLLIEAAVAFALTAAVVRRVRRDDRGVRSGHRSAPRDEGAPVPCRDLAADQRWAGNSTTCW